MTRYNGPRITAKDIAAAMDAFAPTSRHVIKDTVKIIAGSYSVGEQPCSDFNHASDFFGLPEILMCACGCGTTVAKCANCDGYHHHNGWGRNAKDRGDD